MNGASGLDRLAELAGILPSYVDAWGELRQVSATTKAALLTAMGLASETPEEIEASIRRIEEAPWRRPLESVLVTRRARGGRIRIPMALTPAQAGRGIAWRLEKESGEAHDGRLRFAELVRLDSRAVDGETVERRVLTLPFPVPLGYHCFRLFLRDGAVEQVLTLPVIVTPARGRLPERVRRAGRLWGLALQLYGLRSERNWGLGDFSDLEHVTRAAARLGAAAIGLNPLHALFPENPAHASPYSPSHREFLSELYIDVEAVPDLQECEEAQRLLKSPRLRQKLGELRAEQLVDYSQVSAVKRPILELLYRSFRCRHLETREPDAAGGRTTAFRDFQRRRGESLERLGVFQALSEHLGVGAWRNWPVAFRDPSSPAVADFAAAHRDRVEFFQYLQWQAELQFAHASRTAREAGMAVGLYNDLALGPDGGGAEAWMNQASLARGATIGAPPDEWNQKGQNWGLPPYNPLELRTVAYRPFIHVVRANMANSGALRIDHAMSLERLYWIPEEASPQDGGYVRYPVDDMFGILALESVRQDCMLIGEDLGTVPEGFHRRMRAAAMLSYRLLYFAQDGRGEYLRPSRYPVNAAVAVSTHDLATLGGFWHGRDLAVRAELDLFPSGAVKRAAFERRSRDRPALVRALKRERLLAPDFPEEGGEFCFELVEAVYRYLGCSPSRLLLVHLEDVTGEEDQTNMPGTATEHPNWRRRALIDLEELHSDPRMIALAAAIGEERQGRRFSGHRKGQSP